MPESAEGGSHCHRPRRMGNFMSDSSSDMTRSEALKDEYRSIWTLSTKSKNLAFSGRSSGSRGRVDLVNIN